MVQFQWIATDVPALLSQEMSLSGYEYGALAGAPITAPKPPGRAEPAWRFDRS
jgi:hypothetical protein